MCGCGEKLADKKLRAGKVPIIDTDAIAKTMTENGLKQKVLEAAYEQGWLVEHHVQSNRRGSQGRGWPDLSLVRDGEVIFIELKQEGAGLSPYQKSVQAAMGGRYYHIVRPSDLYNGRVQELLS